MSNSDLFKGMIAPPIRTLTAEPEDRPQELDRGVLFMLAGLFAMFAIGLALRIIYAANLSFWNDEIFSRDIITLGWRDFARFFLSGEDIHPPLYYFATKVIYATLPSASEFGLKAQNLIYFVLAFLVVLRHFARFPSLRKPLLFSFLFVNMSATHIYLSGEVRMYGLLSLLTLAALLFFCEFKPGDPAVRYAVGSALLIMLVMTHYFGVMVCVSLGVSWLTVERFNKKSILPLVKLFLAPVATLLIYLPIFLMNLNKGMPYQRTLVDAGLYAGKMFNGYLPLLLFVPAFFFFGSVCIRGLGTVSENETDRLFFMAFSSGLIILAIAFVYYFIKGNSILTFSTLIALVIILSHVLGVTLSKMPLNVTIPVVAIFFLLSIAPIMEGGADPTYFEPNRLAYGAILGSIDRRGYLLDGNSLVLNDEPPISSYSYDYMVEKIYERYGKGVTVVKIDGEDPKTKARSIVRLIAKHPKKKIWLISRRYSTGALQDELRPRKFSLEHIDKGAALLARL